MHKITRFMIALVSLGLLGVAYRAEAAGYQMPVTFAGYTNRTEVLANFPVLVVLSNNVGESGFNYSTTPFLSANGWDLRFKTNLTDTGTTTLNYEIEKWDPTSVSYVWVRIPTIPTNGSGSIWATWGDAADSNQLACTTNGAVWDSNFNGVWHFGDAGPTYASDSTANANMGTKSGGVTFGGAGKVGRAASFDGVDGYINAGPVRAGSAANGLTLSTWVYTSSGDFDGTVRAIAADSTGDPNNQNGFFFILDDRGGGVPPIDGLLIAFDTVTDLCRTTKAGSVIGATPAWYHLVSSYNPSTGISYLYINGVAVATTVIQAGTGNYRPDDNTVLCLGAYPDGTVPLKGTMDECRVSKTARSADWSYAEWLNMASNTTFNSYGAVQAPATGGAPAIRSDAVGTLWTNSAVLQGTLTATGTSATAVYVFWGPGGDQGTNMPSTWANTNFLGINTASLPASYSTNVTGLLAGSNYTYRYYATNTAGNAWGEPQSFTTYIAPLVNNTAGANVLTPTTAWLQGEVTQGNPAPLAYFCVDASDKGTTSTGDWSRVIAVDGTPSGAFSNLVSGLTPSASYVYRCYVTNAAGSDWSDDVKSFTMPTRNAYFCLTANQDRTDVQALSGTNGPGGTATSVEDTGASGLLYNFSAFLGLSTADYRIKANAASLNLTLDMGDVGTTISGGGNIETLATGTSGNITITNAGAITAGQIVTGDGTSGGTKGRIAVAHSGALTASSLMTASSSGFPGGQTYQGDSSGAFLVTATGTAIGSYEASRTGNDPLGHGADVKISGYNGVTVNGLIKTSGYGYGFGGSLDIGTISQKISGAIVLKDITTGQPGRGSRHIYIYGNNSVTVGTITMGVVVPDVALNGGLTVVNQGAFTSGTIKAQTGGDDGGTGSILSFNGTDQSGAFTVAGDIDQYRMSQGNDYGPSLNIANYASVTVTGALRNDMGNNNSYSYTRGAISITNIAGDIAIGSFTADSGYVGKTDGTASLAAGGRITLANLDMGKVSEVKLNAAGGSSITNALAGFSGTGSGTGTLADPVLATQTGLRSPTDVGYNPNLTENSYLGGKYYKLANLAGSPNQGGLLSPSLGKPKGTVVLFL